MTPKTPAVCRLAILWGVVLVAISLCGQASADAPIVIPHPEDASRALIWTFNTSDRLTLQNVELQAGRVILPWTPASTEWLAPAQFAANGTLDSTLTLGVDGIEMAHDRSNHVLDGDLSRPDAWTFANGTSDSVMAGWVSAIRAARIGHDSPSTQVLWDTFDSLNGWTWDPRPDVFGGLTLNMSRQHEGNGMVGMRLEITGTATWAAAVRAGTVDWSSRDFLLIWINATDVIPALSLNVTATVGGSFRTTSSSGLLLGWQELTIDLRSLGNSEERATLQDVRLRVNGQNVPETWLYFDFARIASPKVFDETGAVSQQLTKSNATTALLGSAYLSFDWSLWNSSGIAMTHADVSLAGPSGTFAATLAGEPVGSWASFQADVSATTAAAGTYTLAVQFRVVADNTTESHANLLIDNASLLLPDRRNGTFLSQPIAFGTASEFLNVTWAASIPNGTSATLRMRSGNGSVPNAAWSTWETLAALGTYPSSLTGADHFQMEVDLNTTNASRSPVLESFAVEVQSRVPSGRVVAAAYTAPSDFFRWRSFVATWNRAVATSIAFFVGNGSYRTPVPPGGDLSTFPGPTLAWSADIATADGLQTPELFRIEVVYEYLGPIDRIIIDPTGPVTVIQGHYFTFETTAVDAGNHVLPLPSGSFDWSTNDPTGVVYNNGTYRAGNIGNHTIVVSAMGKFATVQVEVRSAGPAASLLTVLFPYLMLAVLMASAAFAGYEFLIRRMFAIDDVFLISKDGRLMMHNTRRMRADRDEDILSGMLTAILSFVRDADPEENGELRRFDLGGKTTLLERGKSVFVSAVYSGRVPRWAAKDLRRFVADLEARFGTAFASWNGAREDLPDLKEATRRFVSHTRYRSPRDGNGRLGGHAS